MSRQITEQFSQGLFRLQPSSQCPTGSVGRRPSHRVPDVVPTSNWCEKRNKTIDKILTESVSPLIGSNPRSTIYVHIPRNDIKIFWD